MTWWCWICHLWAPPHFVTWQNEKKVTPSQTGGGRQTVGAGGRSRAMRDLGVSSILFFASRYTSIHCSLARVHQTGAICAWNFDFAGTRPHMRARPLPHYILSIEQRKRPIDASLHILHAWHQVRAHTSHMKETRCALHFASTQRLYQGHTHARGAWINDSNLPLPLPCPLLCCVSFVVNNRKWAVHAVNALNLRFSLLLYPTTVAAGALHVNLSLS
jgi:hypothetical protein